MILKRTLLRSCLPLLAFPFFSHAEPLGPIGIFGIGSCHTNNRTVKDMERWIPQMAEAGISFHRTCQTNWSAVEPAEGKWAWEELDREMAYLTEHQMSCGGLLLGSVPWDKRSVGLPVDSTDETT